jgi:hypothetical protein
MLRHVTALVLALCCLPAAAAQAEVVRFPKATAPAFLLDLPAHWLTQEDQYGGLQVFPADHATAIYLSMTRDPQYADHPIKDVATAIATAAGIKELVRQEPATLSGRPGEAFYGAMKNKDGSDLDVKMVLVAMESDLWAVEMAMVPKSVPAAARARHNQMIDRITITDAP